MDDDDDDSPLGLTKPGRRLSHGDVESKLPIEYSSLISSELHALAKMVETEFAQEEGDDDLRKKAAAASNLEHIAAESAPVFERGRFYDEYSAKRNERLKRKSVGGGGDDSVVKGTPYSLGVEPMTTKKRGTTKKKTTTVETTVPRYSLRSMTTKENKEPPLPMNVGVTSAAKKKSVTTTMRGRRI